MTDRSTTPVCPRWLHALAVLTVVLTLPLLFLGAGVTSHGVGMIDREGFRAPWIIVNGLLENTGLAWRLEYGHRTFGFLVGMCAIGFAIGCWFFDARRWMGWIGVLALAMIWAGNNMPARIAIMAITTRSSISVNADRFVFLKIKVFIVNPSNAGAGD